MWSEVKRKLFHLTALIYVAGIIYLPRATFLVIIAAALAIVFAVERLRLARPAVNDFFFRVFGRLFRAEERDRMTGVVWMLTGVLATALLVGPTPLAATALLYLVLGDGVASVAGKAFGGPQWSGSPKRISGSVACFLACVAVGAVVLRPDWGWHGVLAGAVAATLFERGLIPGNDNLTIPVGAGATLLLAYGVRPFVF